MVPAALVHLAIRSVHVLAAALATGGAALVYAVARRSAAAPTLAVATAYEWVFWTALAVLVATGVGNLGAFALSLPGGRWGAVLAGKLALVLAVLALSTLRTVAVCRLRDGASVRPGAIRRWYGATTLGLVALVGAAEVLAHG
jgi:uncharacterized membrane protein